MNGGPDPYQPRRTSALAITALVLSCLFFLPLVPIVGSILGIIALVRLTDRPQMGGKGLAIAAIPVGLVVALFLQGILAAIAIPAFIMYVRKSKTVEATEALDKIRAGAQTFARAHHYDKSGNPQSSAFPAGDTGWVPATPCCEGPMAPMCTPDASPWQAAPWKDLHFNLTGPHYFQYRYEGGGSNFVAEARADLDCDGIFSNYRIEGSIDPQEGPRVQGPIVTDEIE